MCMDRDTMIAYQLSKPAVCRTDSSVCYISLHFICVFDFFQKYLNLVI